MPGITGYISIEIDRNSRHRPKRARPSLIHHLSSTPATNLDVFCLRNDRQSEFTMKIQNRYQSRKSSAHRVGINCLISGVVLGALCAMRPQVAHAEWKERESISPSGIIEGNQFGNSVHLSGDSMFIAAKQRSNGTGEVFIRNLQAGAEAPFTSLQPPAGQQNASGLFGNVVVESDGTLFVGAHRKAAPGDPVVSSAGAVHVYEKNAAGAWAWVQTLTALEPEPADQFGSAIVADGGTLIVSAPRRDTNDRFDSGAVYVFGKSLSGEWVQGQRIQAPVPEEGELFGNVLALSGSRMLVGASFADGANENEGRVYAYEPILGTYKWKLIQTLESPAPAANATFGSSLDLHGDLAVIGAPRESVNGVPSGAVHVFKAGQAGWVAQDKIVPDTPAADVEFGAQVELSKDRKLLAVGAPVDSSAGLFAGAVHLFSNENSTWTEEQKIVSPRPMMFDEFGSVLSLRNNTLLVGVQNDDTAGQQAGAAYLYDSGKVDGGGAAPAPLGSLLGLSLLGGGLVALRRRDGVKR